MAYIDMTDTFSYDTQILYTDLQKLATNATTIYNSIQPALMSAYISGSLSYIPDGSTPLKFDTEDYDTASSYDPSTGKFTPGIVGTYILSGEVACLITSGANTIVDELMRLILYKNGVATTFEERKVFSSITVFTGYESFSYSFLINQTTVTDFWQLYMLGTNHPSTAQTINGGSSSSYIQGRQIPAP